MIRRFFPQNFPSDVVKVLDAMSLTGGKNMYLVGSASVRSALYWADYDAVEPVSVSSTIDAGKRIQEAVKRIRGLPDAFLGDMKIGVIEDWIVLPDSVVYVDGKLQNYSAPRTREKLQELVRANIITPAEGKAGALLAKDSPTIDDIVEMKERFKYHILRWTAKEVFQGFKEIHNKKITLAQAIETPGKVKIDVIAWVQGNRFSEFSCIYRFESGKKILNPFHLDVAKGLLESAKLYEAQGEPFKALKRIFAYRIFQKQYDKAEAMLPVLNGDLGRIYALYADLGTLEYLLEENKGVDMNDVHFELEQFKLRMATIYETPDFLHLEGSLLGKLASALKTNNKSVILQHIKSLSESLKKILEEDTPRHFLL